MNTWSLLASEPSKVSGSQSLVGVVTGAVGACGAGGGGTFWAARVWASKAMAAAKSPPVSGLPAASGSLTRSGLPPGSGSRADAVFIVPEGSMVIGGLVQVKGIFESESGA